MKHIIRQKLFQTYPLLIFFLLCFLWSAITSEIHAQYFAHSGTQLYFRNIHVPFIHYVILASMISRNENILQQWFIVALLLTVRDMIFIVTVPMFLNVHKLQGRLTFGLTTGPYPLGGWRFRVTPLPPPPIEFYPGQILDTSVHHKLLIALPISIYMLSITENNLNVISQRKLTRTETFSAIKFYISISEFHSNEKKTDPAHTDKQVMRLTNYTKMRFPRR